MSPSLAPPELTPRQRLRVAQRLAAGDSVEEAAGLVDVTYAAVDAVLDCPRFQSLLAEQRAKLALSDEDWAQRIKVMARQAAELALADGKVSTVNTLLRASVVLPALATTPAGRAAAERTLARIEAEPADAEDEGEEEEEKAEDATPPIEADPVREAKRRELLATVKPALRPSVARASLALLEHFLAATDPDPTVYEAWFAAQPKPPFAPIALSAEDRAAIRHVTRHNPPWLKGAYLGYYRPPVPAEVFAAANANAVEEASTEAPPPVPEDAAAVLRGRLVRLLDEAAVRLPEELDLAEAVCALTWPNWPAYKGPIDLALLRRVLCDVPLDIAALHRLGSTELAKACLAAAPATAAMAQGP
jgi:hypothetical protein